MILIISISISIGGGAATCLFLLWIKEPVIAGPDGKRLHAYSFGAPAVVPLESICQYRDNITSVVYARDAFSRLSYGSITNLVNIVLCLCSNERSQQNAALISPSSFNSPIVTQTSISESLPLQQESPLQRQRSIPASYNFECSEIPEYRQRKRRRSTLDCGLSVAAPITPPDG